MNEEELKALPRARLQKLAKVCLPDHSGPRVRYRPSARLTRLCATVARREGERKECRHYPTNSGEGYSD